jgi:hypothetical protein
VRGHPREVLQLAIGPLQAGLALFDLVQHQVEGIRQLAELVPAARRRPPRIVLVLRNRARGGDQAENRHRYPGRQAAGDRHPQQQRNGQHHGDDGEKGLHPAPQLGQLGIEVYAADPVLSGHHRLGQHQPRPREAIPGLLGQSKRHLPACLRTVAQVTREQLPLAVVERGKPDAFLRAQRGQRRGGAVGVAEQQGRRHVHRDQLRVRAEVAHHRIIEGQHVEQDERGAGEHQRRAAGDDAHAPELAGNRQAVVAPRRLTGHAQPP